MVYPEEPASLSRLAPYPHTSSAASIVAFDFDGTITNVDTLRRFFRYAVGLKTLAVASLLSSPILIRAAWNSSFRDEAKSELVKRLLEGRSHDELVDVARGVAADTIDRHLRPDTVRHLEWHQAQGHQIVIVSASFEAQVRPVAQHLGVSDIIATRWEVDETSGQLTGRLQGSNVRGPNKVTALLRQLGPDTSLEYAYGNSDGDREMLELAVNALWVNRRGISQMGPGEGDSVSALV